MVPIRVYNILISTQHNPDVSNEEINQGLTEKIIKKIVPEKMLDGTKIVCNPAGKVDIGGPAAMLKDMIGEMLGMERHPVSIDAKGNDFHITIGQSFEYNATIITNPMTEEPVKIVGMMHPAGDELTMANVHKSNASIMGVSFSGENLSG